MRFLPPWWYTPRAFWDEMREEKATLGSSWNFLHDSLTNWRVVIERREASLRGEIQKICPKYLFLRSPSKEKAFPGQTLMTGDVQWCVNTTWIVAEKCPGKSNNFVWRIDDFGEINFNNGCIHFPTERQFSQENTNRLNSEKPKW